MTRAPRWTKRAFDLAVVLGGAVLWLPLCGLIALLVHVKLGKPVLFRQQRPGLLGRPFHLLKFRTMTDARDPSGDLLDDGARLTRFGRWLRSSSLDELPELINVLRGEMSLVGPRPLLMQYWSRYSPEQRRRHDVLPGITGWAQINGRNSIDWPERFELDLWYVNNRSLWLDVKILGLTIARTLRREGITQAGHVTHAEFLGGAPNKAK